MTIRQLLFGAAIAPLLFALLISAARGEDEYEREPISYSKTAPRNRVSRLLDEISTGKKELAHEDHFGYLKPLLKELGIKPSTQTLVFSKTSLQRQKICPQTPRSLFFGDDIYVGFCQQGDVLEISAVDPQLGAVFYTIDQEKSNPPKIVRQTDNCLICHGSSQTKGIPGHLIRSVFADALGLPILSGGTYRIDHTSPIEQRWGGWYVTGKHGGQKHLGNLVIQGREVPREIDNAAGQNVTSLEKHIDVRDYVTPHSDIAALMVLEHQAEAHNLITRANISTRQALAYEAALNKDLKNPPTYRWPSTTSRIKSVTEPLVEYFLFCEEAPLTAKFEGTSGFAAEFSGQGPRDKQGRSLRELDLQRRMFKYPCSYLVYSESFQALPEETKGAILKRLFEVLSGQDKIEKFAHLSAADRQATLEILRDTLPGLPEYWK